MVANNHDYRAGIFARTLRSLQGGTSNPDLWVPQVYSTKGMDQTYRAMIKAGNERGLDLFVFDLDDILDPTFPKRETHSPALEKLLYPADGTIQVLANFLKGGKRGSWVRELAELPGVAYEWFVPPDHHEYAMQHFKLFNPPSFPVFSDDKLLAHEVVRHTPNLTEVRVPETSLYSREGLLDMLGAHGKVFFKPRYGMMARGIFSVERVGRNNIKIKRDQSTKYGGHKGDNTVVTSLEDGVAYIEQVMIDNLRQRKLESANRSGHPFTQYLIQEAVDVYSMRHADGSERVTDVRTFIQRGKKGELYKVVSISRVGAVGNICANLSTGGYAVPTEHVLDQVLGGNRPKVRDAMERIFEGSEKIYRAFEERTGPIGEAAFDYLIDGDGVPSFCEINTRPGRESVITMFGKRALPGVHYYVQGKDRDMMAVSTGHLVDYLVHLCEQQKTK